jgi:DNA-binding IclR family transcriptional regulator
MQESEDGVIAVAVPLGTHAGARYAVSISAPSHRKQDFTEVAVAEDLLRFAEQCRSFFS